VAYLLLKWLHALAAIAVVGAHITYGVWIVRASSHPEALPFTLRNVRWLDGRISGPAYGVLLVTGLGMATIVRPWFTGPWLLAGLVLFVVLVLAHVFGYSPTLRQMIRLLDSEGVGGPGYQAAAHREARLGIAMILVMVAIVFLMVVKPRLWA
jgi:uncharacterized membrane protein